MSGNLYQLRSSRKYYPGEEFIINGPYDKYGRVITCIHKPTDRPEHKGMEYFNLIRGTGNE